MSDRYDDRPEPAARVSAPLQPGDRVEGPRGLRGVIDALHIDGFGAWVKFEPPFYSAMLIRLDALTRIEPPAATWTAEMLRRDDLVSYRDVSDALQADVSWSLANEIIGVRRVIGRAELRPDGTIVRPEPPWTKDEAAQDAQLAAFGEFEQGVARDAAEIAYLRGMDRARERYDERAERFAWEGR